MAGNDEEFDIGMATIMSMGFEEDLARRALTQMNGNAEQALDAILNGAISAIPPKSTPVKASVIPTTTPVKATRDKKPKVRKPVSEEPVSVAELEALHSEDVDFQLALALSNQLTPAPVEKPTSPDSVKYTLHEDKIRLTHSQEAQLQEAEKEWQDGDFEADDELQQLEKPDFDIR